MTRNKAPRAKLQQRTLRNPVGKRTVFTAFDNKGNGIATNTGWTTDTTPSSISTAALEAEVFGPPNPSAEPALLLTPQSGAHTAQVTSAKGNPGIAVFEAYTDWPTRLHLNRSMVGESLGLGLTKILRDYCTS